ncbi:MAG: DNA replication and repair protein RecF [Actinobacteria bacterium]|nr:DNA replication and repair protein RecF [Actinomycetota bacterium]
MASALLRRLSLTNVRSHRDLDLRLAPGLNLLAGPNGAGKTTILEAVVLLLRGTMLRSGSLKDLIMQGEDYLRVEADLSLDGVGTTAAAAYSRAGERRLTAGGAELADPSRWLESLPLRTFLPDDLRLIKGSPRRRREYLDELAGKCDQEYGPTLRRYNEALCQRNTLLRTRWSGVETAQFVPWERILAQTGLAVTSWRAGVLSRFIEPFQNTHALLTGEPRDTVRIVYRTNVADLEEGEYEVRLAENRGADQQRTFTHLGPHRDDLRLIRRDLDMRECASQGEQRTAVLALVLAEWGCYAECSGRGLLLLDDVMSELDDERRRGLMDIVMKGGQTVMTTTNLRYFTRQELEQAAVIELTKA